MITIQTRNDLLIQLHKSQLSGYLGDSCNVEITGFNGTVAMLSASVQTLTNCYILTILDASPLETLGLNASMKVLGSFNVVLYRSKVQLFIPSAPIEQ